MSFLSVQLAVFLSHLIQHILTNLIEFLELHCLPIVMDNLVIVSLQLELGQMSIFEDSHRKTFIIGDIININIRLNL